MLAIKVVAEKELSFKVYLPTVQQRTSEKTKERAFCHPLKPV